MDLMWVAVICGVLGLGVVGFMAWYVMRQDQGSEKVREISDAIKEGAIAFLAREYRTLAIFVVIIAVILGVIPDLGWWVSVAFIFGAICSGLTGYIGMSIAIRANSRTTTAAQKSLNQGLRVAFRSGSVMGMSIVAIGLIGVSILYFAFHTEPAEMMKIIPGYGFGASLVAIFARVGGGIYTKAADTGADIVGKVERGIPEDDPRNPAVVADFVGDNVGDVAGMGADLFESYVESIIATITLGTVAAFSAVLGKSLVPDEVTAWSLPMLVAAGGIIASIIGILAVRVGEQLGMKALLNALRRGTYITTFLGAVFSFLIVYFLKADIGIFWAILAGLVAGVIIGESTNYFTSYVYKPTLRIAESTQTGAATTIISGFANGLMSTLPPILVIVIAIMVAYKFADVYGVAVAGVGLLAVLGMQDATDAYGPVADNAGGIAQMAELPPGVRERTDALDSLGNTTAAVGKGFAPAGAGLTALALLLAYTQAAGIQIADISLLQPHVIAGIFIGVVYAAVFSAMTMSAVGKTSFVIVNEVRRQFREIVGLAEGTARPEYGRCVDICTRAALKQMIVPGLVTVALPVVVGFILGPVAVAAMLLGALACGFMFAIAFANAGGSWDNAKKWIENGAFGGKGSDAHKAAVIGDTVGDPMKDTTSPCFDIMIKLMSIVALLLAPVLAGMTGLI